MQGINSNHGKEYYGGRVEAATDIKALEKSGFYFGVLRDKTPVVFSGPKRFAGEGCLVRILSKPPSSDILPASYISSSVPEEFKGLSQNEYALIALLGGLGISYQKNLNPGDAFEDIREHFNPGDLEEIAYFGQLGMLGGEEGEIYFLDSSGRGDVDSDFQDAVRSFLDPKRRKGGPRLYAATSELQVKTLERVLREEGRFPIQMECYKQITNL